MARNKKPDTDALVEKIRALLPMHHRDVATALEIPEQRAYRLIRQYIPEQLNTVEEKGTTSNELWGRNDDDYFIEPLK